MVPLHYFIKMSAYTRTLINQLPWLGKYKRWLSAWIDASSPIKCTYAQHGEDTLVYERLVKYNLSQSIYVDVGANHPTTSSNTYLLYRLGIHGVVIEPNPHFVRLHHIIRPKDIALGIGCGLHVGLGKFQILATPGIGFFDNQSGRSTLSSNVRILRSEYIPILPLDIVLQPIYHDWICFLSIDTEGQDYEVLLGAHHTLSKTLLVCVEFDNAESRNKIINLMQAEHFMCVAALDCNLIFENTLPTYAATHKHGLVIS